MSLSDEIGVLVGKSGQSVRFHALRMMLEVLKGERLTVPVQKKLYNKAKFWEPE